MAANGALRVVLGTGVCAGIVAIGWAFMKLTVPNKEEMLKVSSHFAFSQLLFCLCIESISLLINARLNVIFQNRKRSIPKLPIL